VGPRTGLDDVEKILTPTGTRTPTPRHLLWYVTVITYSAGGASLNGDTCALRVSLVSRGPAKGSAGSLARATRGAADIHTEGCLPPPLFDTLAVHQSSLSHK
jgi:hypothetical protein